MRPPPRRPPVPAVEPLEPRALLSWTFFGPGSLFADTPAPPVNDNLANPNSVIADFDGDGIADLATAAGRTISFAKGHADGTFDAIRTTNFGAPVGFISAGRFDGTGRASLVSVGTNGGSVSGSRPNPGFRLRAFAFDLTAHADVNGAAAGAFVFTAAIDVPDFHQGGRLPTAVVADMFSGWRDEFAINLQTPAGENRIAVFSFKNRTTIVRNADIPTYLIAYGLTAGDLLGAGKAQLLFSRTDFVGSRTGGVYMQYYSTISIARPFSSSATSGWSTSDIRTFPVRDLTFALGDWDNDAHTDIVALATRDQSPENHYTSDSRLWLLRSLGGGAFAAPRALGDRHVQADWSAPPGLDEPGRPSLVGLADLNGDGRLDALLTSISVFYYRLNTYSLQLTAAIQSPGGAADILPIPSVFGETSGSSTYAPFGVQVLPPASAAQPPSILIGGTHLIRAATDPQPPKVIDFSAFVQSLVPGQSSTGLPAQFSAHAFDADALRGGSIDRVEFYIDTNHDNQVDAMDILVGAATSPEARYLYTLTVPVDSAWGTPGSTVHMLARAVDDLGIFSTPFAADLSL